MTIIKKYPHSILLIFCLFLGKIQAKASNYDLFSPMLTPPIRGLYVDDFHNILGNIAKENAVLTYAQAKGFNYLALYELHYFDFNTDRDRSKLAAFIYKAKHDYGILQVAATGEIASFFNNRILAQYQASRTNPLEKFDVLNLEFEYWSPVFTDAGGYYCTTYLQPNGLTCDRTGAFTFYMQQLTALRQLCNTNNLICETEFGWFTQAEANQIVPLSDRILVHAYVPTSWVNSDPATFYNYTKDRLSYIGNAAASPKEVMVIFSSEPDFSGPWLNATTPARLPQSAFDLYKTYFDAETAIWKTNLSQVGYQWFTYSQMPENGAILPLDLLDFNGNTEGSKNVLHWQTAHEINLSHFDIERSSDGKTFEKIGTLYGGRDAMHRVSTTTTMTNQYVFADIPKTTTKTMYYRLKINDLDKTFTYSKIIALERKGTSKVRIYPSLTTGILTIEGAQKFEIVNMMGQVVTAYSRRDFESRRECDLSHLPSGIYVVKGVDTEGSYFSEKIIKQ